MMNRQVDKPDSMDPVTFAVIKNKIREIVESQTIAIQHISGSPIVNEATDFNNGLFLAEDGSSVEIGLRAPLHGDSLSEMVRAITRECRENPGIFEDDQFYCNDPWKGAIHQSDCGMVAPIFYHGDLVMWSGCLAHQIDIGGAQPGSWVPQAEDVFMEAVPIPPVKLVEKGKMRQDIWNVLLAHSRLPFLVALDYKAFIGANNIAKKRFTELADRYGIRVVLEVIKGMLKSTEAKLRDRLREIPNGIYRSVTFLNHDGHQNKLYKVMVTGTKLDDTLTLDFTGTDPQAPGFINITAPSTRGAVASAALPCLCFDMDWNGGIFAPINIIVQPGTLNGAKYPAPVSGGTCNVQFICVGALHHLFALMLACTPKYKDKEVSASPTIYAKIFNLTGLNQFGEPFGTMLTDSQASGEGAFSFKDGAAAHSTADTPAPNIADIETVENIAPVLYLYRRIIADEGGAGKWKGGEGGGAAFTLHNASSLTGTLVGTGNETPQVGLCGGYPGGCGQNSVVKGSDIMEKLGRGEFNHDMAELKGQKIDLGTKPGGFTVLPGDVFEITFEGAGGFGDPLERETERVLEDVINGRVSRLSAEAIYGVVIKPEVLKVDSERTQQKRREILAQRLTDGRTLAQAKQKDATGAVVLMPLGEYLEVIQLEKEKIVRCRCGYQFGPLHQNWKDYASVISPNPEALGPGIKLHKDLEIRQYFCPQCGLSLDVETLRRGESPLFDIELKF
jgi:N-methylhydantoinase B